MAVPKAVKLILLEDFPTSFAVIKAWRSTLVNATAK